LAACPSFRAACARASEAEARGALYWGAGREQVLDATSLTTDKINPCTCQQQDNLLGARFEAAKDMYARTGEHKSTW
jgi:hypothetical protein